MLIKHTKNTSNFIKALIHISEFIYLFIKYSSTYQLHTFIVYCPYTLTDSFTDSLRLIFFYQKI